MIESTYAFSAYVHERNRSLGLEKLDDRTVLGESRRMFQDGPGGMGASLNTASAVVLPSTTRSSTTPDNRGGLVGSAECVRFDARSLLTLPLMTAIVADPRAADHLHQSEA